MDPSITRPEAAGELAESVKGWLGLLLAMLVLAALLFGLLYLVG